MTSDDIELVLTKHSRKQMFDRGIDEGQIKRVIQRGSKIKQTDGFKAVHMYIGVSYKIRGNKYIIKTVTIE
jgi:hypothetical protein